MDTIQYLPSGARYTVAGNPSNSPGSDATSTHGGQPEVAEGTETQALSSITSLPPAPHEVKYLQLQDFIHQLVEKYREEMPAIRHCFSLLTRGRGRLYFTLVQSARKLVPGRIIETKGDIAPMLLPYEKILKLNGKVEVKLSPCGKAPVRASKCVDMIWDGWAAASRIYNSPSVKVDFKRDLFYFDYKKYRPRHSDRVFGYDWFRFAYDQFDEESVPDPKPGHWIEDIETLALRIPEHYGQNRCEARLDDTLPFPVDCLSESDYEADDDGGDLDVKEKGASHRGEVGEDEDDWTNHKENAHLSQWTSHPNFNENKAQWAAEPEDTVYKFHGAPLTVYITDLDRRTLRRMKSLKKVLLVTSSARIHELKDKLLEPEKEDQVLKASTFVEAEGLQADARKTALKGAGPYKTALEALFREFDQSVEIRAVMDIPSCYLPEDAPRLTRVSRPDEPLLEELIEDLTALGVNANADSESGPSLASDPNLASGPSLESGPSLAFGPQLASGRYFSSGPYFPLGPRSASAPPNPNDSFGHP
ncbi:hypothetical protein DL764_000934 [Monosporascus ibericus]|uniref:Uncharacterized protein n=1 Tax=Monosporascus ibericus TaxID=155417 RepID=A0A4Q4TRJ3_9PEZI|nr:hypothetical protein DL764_000934 [Monosporascus ibericus]